MVKLDKQIARIPAKERLKIERVIGRIIAHDLSGLDVKKLKGLKNAFRLRKSNFRIIFQFEKSESTILSIERRNDRTYDF